MPVGKALRRRAAAMAAAALLVLAVDLSRAPDDQWSAHAAVATIHVYQGTLSRWFTRAGAQCRFTITCSHYGEACIRRFGAARGGWMALKRVVRCGPWTPMGTVDPPPAS